MDIFEHDTRNSRSLKKNCRELSGALFLYEYLKITRFYVLNNKNSQFI
jgi:hypothetical protein